MLVSLRKKHETPCLGKNEGPTVACKYDVCCRKSLETYPQARGLTMNVKSHISPRKIEKIKILICSQNLSYQK